MTDLPKADAPFLTVSRECDATQLDPDGSDDLFDRVSVQIDQGRQFAATQVKHHADFDLLADRLNHPVPRSWWGGR